jgi:diguanylate cyclase (GGDEF)-like protein
MRLSITPTPRIALGLLALCASLFILADLMFGIVADRSQQAQETRSRVAESLTAQLTDLLRKQELRRVARALAAAQHGNPDLVSAAVRDSSGAVVASHGVHAVEWDRYAGRSTDTHVVVPIQSAQGTWGRLEMEFTPVVPGSPLAWLRDRMLWLALGLPLAALALMYLYLRHTLTHLNPLAVVPDRLRSAFDGLTAGVALLDRQGRVVLANAALRQIAAVEADKAMHGRPLEQAAHIEVAEPGDRPEPLPWMRVLNDGQGVRGIRVYVGHGAQRAVGILNCAPVLDHRQRVRGCLATVDDVTAIERNNEELRQANAALEATRAHIEAQNQELIKLATRDPLTGLLNRRAFMDGAAPIVERNVHGGGCVAVMMMDVDHFKSFNDKYGHAVGDQVLQRVSKHLAATLRLPDLVARYGGEEFCVLAEVDDVAVAMDLAERVRRAVATRAGAGLREGAYVSVTISIGVAVCPPQAPDVSSLLNAADAALYEAKRSGRNRVVLADVHTVAATLL